MKEKKAPKDDWRELKELITLSLSYPKIWQSLPYDLLTQKERIELAKRWQIIKMLSLGIPQHEIAQKLQVGVATVTRGSNMLKNPTGAFNQLLKIYDKHKLPKTNRSS